jgi:hypothetical protein
MLHFGGTVTARSLEVIHGVKTFRSAQRCMDVTHARYCPAPAPLGILAASVFALHRLVSAEEDVSSGGRKEDV